MRDAGIAVLVIRDNPSFDDSGPKCALENTSALARCSEPLTHALRSAADLHAARAVAGVRVLDLTDRFCPRARCYHVLGSILAYRDSNHLTAEMVLSLKPRLDAAIDAMS